MMFVKVCLAMITCAGVIGTNTRCLFQRALVEIPAMKDFSPAQLRGSQASVMLMLEPTG